MTAHRIPALLAAAREVQQRAYAPYSQFQVGAALYTDKGTLFRGCNVENASYGLGMCAENSTIANMVSQGENRIAEILVIGSGPDICSPCGRCRQLILEFAEPTTPVHMCDCHGSVMTRTLAELLPYSFSKQHLSMG